MSRRAGRGHPNIRVVVWVWVGLFVVGVIAAVIFHDDNPKTDDGAAWGALIALVGWPLTGLYLGGSLLVRAVRQHRSGESRIEFPTVTRRSVRSAVLVAAVSIVALTVVGLISLGAKRLWRGGAERQDPVALVRSAAQTASPQTRILAIDCTRRRFGGVLSCAVTFEGPACQVWAITEDGHPTAIGEPLSGMRGSATGTGTTCAV